MIEEIGANDEWGANVFFNAFVRNYSYDEDLITLKKMEDWSFLGNIKEQFIAKKALLYDADHDPIIDLFGYRLNYTLPVTHLQNSVNGWESELADVSYYYSARPYFLPSPNF